jgi:poly(A) polymerase
MVNNIMVKSFGSHQNNFNGVKRTKTPVQNIASNALVEVNYDPVYNLNDAHQKFLQKSAMKIVKALTNEGYQAYFTGGWVRDNIIGCPSSDIDIVTNAPPGKIVELYPDSEQAGQAFGVFFVEIKGERFEVANFRQDIDCVNGRKPTAIALATPEKDAQRRDLTINGLFFDPINKKILDYVGGMEDIQKKTIQTIGNPTERFAEDRLRMIRTIRFAARLGFKISPETKKGILNNAHALFPAVSIDLICKEFKKMAESPNFHKALIKLHRLTLLPIIFPQLKNASLDDVKNYVKFFEYFPSHSPVILHLMELFPNASLKEQIEVCRHLKTSRKEIELVELTFQMREKIQNELRTGKDAEKSEWAKIYANPSFQICLEVISARESAENRAIILQKHMNQRKSLQVHVDRTLQKKTVVTGKILQQYGIPKNKVMQVLINEAEKIAINKDMTDPHAVIELLKQSPSWPII